MPDYYDKERLLAIRNSKNYQDLLLVAMDVLEDMNDDFSPRPIAQVCGPISSGGRSSRAENLAVFSRAIDRITADGLVVFNQIPFEDDMIRIYNSRPEMGGLRLLEEFYLPIFKSGFINLLCFLPSWQTSLGAKWEHEQAKKLKIPILYLAQFYVDDLINNL